MTAINHFQAFEKSVRKVLQEAKTEKEIVTQITPYFQLLIEKEGLIPESYKKPKQDKYRQYLLYKPQDEEFSIVLFVWGPGHTAPIHDHLVWGLVGVYEGAIEETRYKKTLSDQSPDDVHLEVINTVTAKKSDISFVYPPNADIHSVRNPYKDTAITIHIYGTDIGKQKRNSYQKETYAVNPIVTPHENEVPIYQ
ncbi:cysteine dioxygenase family protein [Niallia oryzisoli]|uniref:Cysteine dioxygenase family protein n=1 Tax=Niallia oryzisoli TaxID=1737571 RepID=A0ABZ2C8K3_9BACI